MDETRKIIERHLYESSAAKYFDAGQNSYLHQNFVRGIDAIMSELCPVQDRTIDSLTDDECVEISRIFYPNEKMALSFASRWEHTRVNVGRHIVSGDFPVAFNLKKYFQLFEYLKSKGVTIS